MTAAQPLHVKIATEPWEFEQIHRLNHRTFAEEIPQHAADPSGRLVDRFHSENTYVIALAGDHVLGMLAVRGRRPFALDARLADLDQYLPAGRSICELRLLAVDRASRSGHLLPALLDFVWRYCLQRGFDVAIITAILRQLKLYRHLGFEPFGPVVGTDPVLFQPMMLTLERFLPRSTDVFRGAAVDGPVAGSFLPGPVAVHEDVIQAFQQAARSHRSQGFVDDLRATRDSLGRLVNAPHAVVLMGSGTTANDIVAGQLSRLRGPGMVLTNGEFGDRLVDHARRWRLSFDVVARAWGEPFDVDQLARDLDDRPAWQWIWCTHCETSTGVLNDLDALKALCGPRGVRVCLDAISSVGMVPVDLEGVYLASAVSGKALGALPGLAIVFSDHHVAPAPADLPRALDLGLYLRGDGVPFTHSSNLVSALRTAVERVRWPDRFEQLAATGSWVRCRLQELGFRVVGAHARPAPGVVTIALPPTVDSAHVSASLETQGYLIGAHSEYLVERNWIQICFIGETSRPQLTAVLNALAAGTRT